MSGPNVHEIAEGVSRAGMASVQRDLAGLYLVLHFNPRSCPWDARDNSISSDLGLSVAAWRVQKGEQRGEQRQQTWLMPQSTFMNAKINTAFE